MKKVALTLFALTLHLISNAQIEAYDISTYARPDLQRQVFNLTPEFAFSHVTQKNGGSFNDDRDLNLLGSFSAVKSKFVNTAEEQTYIVNVFDFESYYVKDDGYYFTNQWFSDGVDDLNNSSFFINRGRRFENRETKNALFLSPAFFRTYSKKRFKKDGKRFFETSYVGFFDLDYFRFKDVGLNENINEINADIRIDVPLFFGNGRIEFVDDAWHAHTILEFLQKDGFLERAVAAEEVEDFAEQISVIKNFRNTDFRLEDIAEFETLCAYLVENELIDPTKYGLFSVLSDVWQRENFITRRSGTEIKYGLVPSVDFFDQLNQSEEDRYFLETSLAASVAFNQYRPRNLNWQTNWENVLRIGPAFNRDLANNETEEERLTGQLISSYEVQFLPSLRTFFLLGLEANYQFAHFFEEDNDTFHNLNVVLNSQFRYYVSPQLSYFATGQFTLRQSKNSIWAYDHRNGSNINVGLVYSFY